MGLCHRPIQRRCQCNDGFSSGALVGRRRSWTGRKESRSRVLSPVHTTRRPRRLAFTSTLSPILLALSFSLPVFNFSSAAFDCPDFHVGFPWFCLSSHIITAPFLFAFLAQESSTGLGELLLRRPAAAVDAFSTIRHRCLQKPLVLRTARHFSGGGWTAMARREVCRGKTEFRESLARALWPAGARVNAEMKRFR